MKAIFLFFRNEGFYLVEIPPEDLHDNITCNPGTLKVDSMMADGNTVAAWTQAAAPSSRVIVTGEPQKTQAINAKGMAITKATRHQHSFMHLIN